MRAMILTTVAVVGLSLLPATVRAAPLAPNHSAVAAPGVILVRDGCGPGWHARWWRDRWGRPHRRCVPNRRWY